ncbi:Unknown protein sequence [Pseudomonas amygdali pv. lachrymans]|uniref:Uncharacterized protein n=1 Tax=Pseudomonas amygdali pv. lachrymans TaxID=53707 RepID=A0ABR5KSE2_PSEAV|nr:Unknown protein sequence [Pseudomonas amygdali pv. lachrymans]
MKTYGLQQGAVMRPALIPELVGPGDLLIATTQGWEYKVEDRLAWVFEELFQFFAALGAQRLGQGGFLLLFLLGKPVGDVDRFGVATDMSNRAWNGR